LIQRINLFKNTEFIMIRLIGFRKTGILLRPSHTSIVTPKKNELKRDRILGFSSRSGKPISTAAQCGERVLVDVDLARMSHTPIYLRESRSCHDRHNRQNEKTPPKSTNDYDMGMKPDNKHFRSRAV